MNVRNIKTITSNPNRFRRSLLFMPGDSLHKITKATTLDLDAVIMDLEDGVAFNQKEVARQTVLEALTTLDFGKRERLVRLNEMDTELFEADLEMTIAGYPDGYVIPKVETADELIEIDRQLTEWENILEFPAPVRLLAMIETATGIMNLREIAQATPRLEVLMLGAEDLASDLDATRTRAGWEIFYGRSAVVTAAAAYGLQAVDTVFIDLNDIERLYKECRFALHLGYIGKAAIHPQQLETINIAFAPASESIESAYNLLKAFEDYQKKGVGVFTSNGKMIDRPMVRAAQRLVDRAHRDFAQLE